MISWLVRWSLRFRLLVAAVAAGVLGFGLVSLPSMAVDNLPEFAPPHVEIQTEALGLSAEEVEQLITSPMEADLLNGVAWLDEIRSVSVPGLSSIELVFEPGTDVLRARQLVAERLTQAFALPNVSTPPVLMQPLSSTSRVMKIQLTSEDVSLIDMSVLARWTVKPVLMGVPGVANVSTWGQREQQLQVQVEPERLQAAGVTLDDVVKTAGNAVWVSPLSFLEASTPGTGGFIESANQRIGIQHVLPIQTPEDLGKVVIEGNAPLTLADVADLSEDHQPLIGDAITGDTPGLLIVIEKFPEADVVDVTRGIEAAMADLAPGLVDIEVDTTVFRPATFLENAAGQLGWAALAGLLLAALVIGLGLGSWRYALIAALAVLVSGTAAALTLQATGAVMNTMTLAGLALALTVAVGDAVADLDALQHRGGGPAHVTGLHSELLGLLEVDLDLGDRLHEILLDGRLDKSVDLGHRGLQFVGLLAEDVEVDAVHAHLEVALLRGAHALELSLGVRHHAVLESGIPVDDLLYIVLDRSVIRAVLEGDPELASADIGGRV